MNIDYELMKICGYTEEELFLLMRSMNEITLRSKGLEEMVDTFEERVPKRALVMLVMALKKSLDELREQKITDIHSAIEASTYTGIEIKEMSREEYENITKMQQRVRSIKEEETSEDRPKGIPIFMGKPGKA